MRKIPTVLLVPMGLLAIFILLALLASCVKDDLWHERFSQTIDVGAFLTVGDDHIAVIAPQPADEFPLPDHRGSSFDRDFSAPIPGYLTVVSSRYYEHPNGRCIPILQTGLQVMHNVLVRVIVVEGNPTAIATLACVISGLASRYDVDKEALLGPKTAVARLVEMKGGEGTTSFRVFGAAPPSGAGQALDLTLVQTDGRRQTISLDVSEVMATLTPYPVAVNVDGSVRAFSDAAYDVTLTIEIRLMSSLQGIVFSATLSDWVNELSEINPE